MYTEFIADNQMFPAFDDEQAVAGISKSLRLFFRDYDKRFPMTNALSSGK
jgi:hypothetical protein